MPLSGISWRVAAILALCSPLCACQQGERPLDRDAMARQLRTLASLSAEGAFLTGELRAGHLKPSFAAVHIEDLSKDANDARREIAKPAPPALQRQHAAAQTLADRLAHTLSALAMAQGGPDAQLEREQRAFARLKTEFDGLEKRL